MVSGHTIPSEDEKSGSVDKGASERDGDDSGNGDLLPHEKDDDREMRVDAGNTDPREDPGKGPAVCSICEEEEANYGDLCKECHSKVLLNRAISDVNEARSEGINVVCLKSDIRAVKSAYHDDDHDDVIQISYQILQKLRDIRVGGQVDRAFDDEEGNDPDGYGPKVGAPSLEPLKLIKKDPSSRYLPSAVLEHGRATPEDREQAVILSHLYHHAAEEHLRYERSALISGAVLMVVGFVLLVLGLVDFVPMALIGLLVILVGLVYIFYGYYIHQPVSLESLSKVHAVTYLLPFKSAIFIDGTDIVPDQALEYRSISLDEICKECEDLPEPPLSFDREKRMVETLLRIEELCESERPYALFTPALLNADVYTRAVTSCLDLSVDGWPRGGLLRTRVDYDEARRHVEELAELADLKPSLELIDEMKTDIFEHAEPFCDNLTECVDAVDSYFNRVQGILQGHFFSGLYLNSDPSRDEQYGYGVSDTLYHIPVGQFRQNHDRSIPLDPVQLVIDNFDGSIKDAIQSIRSDAIDKMKQQTSFKDQMVSNTKENFEMQIISQSNEIQRVQSDIHMLGNQISDLQHQENQFLGQENRESKSGRLEAAQRARYMAEQARFQINQIGREISMRENQVRVYNQQIQTLRNICNNKTAEIEAKAQSEIDGIRSEMESKILNSRRHIDPVVQERDALISVMAKTLERSIISEHYEHKSPFEKRLEFIDGHIKKITARLTQQSNAISNLQDLIEGLEIDLDIDHPILLAIPFWIAKFEAGTPVQYIVLPPQDLVRPDVTGNYRTNALCRTVNAHLESSKHYIEKGRFLQEAEAHSLFPMGLHPGVGKAMHRLCSEGYFTDAICRKMQRHYQIRGAS